MMQRPLRFPQLSHAERDRRWQLARDFMDRQGLDCLLVFGSERHGVPLYGNWFTNDRPGTTLLFPRHGELVGLCWSTQVISAHLECRLRGDDSWIQDLRRGAQGTHIVAAIKELGLEGGTVGVLGLSGLGPIGIDGEVPYKAWAAVLEGLPQVSFREVDQQFFPLLLPLSDEELVLVERSAEIGELACEAMLEATRAGATELDIYAATLDAITRQGAFSPLLILQSGPDNSSWGPPDWLHRSQSPRVIEDGDIVMAELFPHVGMMETQQQMCIAVGRVSAQHERLAELARAGYEAGLTVLSRREPNLDELVEAMEKPIHSVGAWNITPMVHTMNPMGYGGSVAIGIERQLPGIDHYRGVTGMRRSHRDLVLRPGMTFAFEPNAHFGKQRVNIGGTVVMTEGAPIELNRLCNQMLRVAV